MSLSAITLLYIYIYIFFFSPVSPNTLVDMDGAVPYARGLQIRCVQIYSHQ